MEKSLIVASSVVAPIKHLMKILLRPPIKKKLSQKSPVMVTSGIRHNSSVLQLVTICQRPLLYGRGGMGCQSRLSPLSHPFHLSAFVTMYWWVNSAISISQSGWVEGNNREQLRLHFLWDTFPYLMKWFHPNSLTLKLYPCFVGFYPSTLISSNGTLESNLVDESSLLEL